MKYLDQNYAQIAENRNKLLIVGEDFFLQFLLGDYFSDLCKGWVNAISNKKIVLFFFGVN